MPKAIDLTAQHFGDWVVVEKAPSRSGKTYWLCKSQYGEEREIQTSHLRSGNIPQNTQSKEKTCLNCGKVIPAKNTKYCNNQCQNDHIYQEYISRWKEGLEKGARGTTQLSNHIRRYMFEKFENKCSKCGWGEINLHTGNIPLEVEHIDGNHLNNQEGNLDLLCPNCHSLTSTYKGANKGNGREARRTAREA